MDPPNAPEEIIGARPSSPRVAIVAGVTATYIVLLIWLLPLVGSNIAYFSLVPIAVAAWAYGMRTGIVAGLLAYPAHISISMMLGEHQGFADALATQLPGRAIGVLAGGTAGYLRDIRARLRRELAGGERAQLALSKETEFRRAVENSMSAGIVAANLEGRLIYVNRSFCEMVGYSEQELVGKLPPFVYWPPEDKDSIMARYRQVFSGDMTQGVVEFRLLNRDGRRFQVQMLTAPLRGGDGIFTGWVASVIDVTERKRAERELRLSRQRLEAILELAPNAMISVDEDHRITMFNRGAQEIFMYSAEEVVGRPLEMLLPERFRSVHRRHMLDFGAGKESSKNMSLRLDIYAMRKDGTEFPSEASISQLDLEGETVFTVMLRDISARKEAAKALKDSNRRLEETVTELRETRDQIVQQERLRALGTMASGIAHDFNNNLLPIVALSDLLLADDDILEDRSRVTQYLRMIRTAGIDASDVVGRLREFYRDRDESETFSLVNLPSLVKEVMDLTRPKWEDQAQAKGVDISVRTVMEGPEFVPADESGLRSLLTNLVFNAVDAMPHGGEITIRSRPGDGSLVLEVSDTGIGMSEETRRRCLDPFFTTKGEQGTGLGLAIVHGIVQRHAGSIDIRSEPGKGTTFSIRIPTSDRAYSTPASSDPAPRAAAAYRILLVDDDPRALEAVSELLSSAGHAVQTAISGGDALSKFAQGKIDVVVTDLAMPDMNGDKLAAAIKLAAPATSVIMLTGFGDMMEVAGERPEGVDLVLKKPVTLLSLRRALDEVATK